MGHAIELWMPGAVILYELAGERAIADACKRSLCELPRGLGVEDGVPVT